MDVVKSTAAAYSLAVDAREAAYAEMTRVVTFLTVVISRVL